MVGILLNDAIYEEHMLDALYSIGKQGQDVILFLSSSCKMEENNIFDENSIVKLSDDLADEKGKKIPELVKEYGIKVLLVQKQDEGLADVDCLIYILNNSKEDYFNKYYRVKQQLETTEDELKQAKAYMESLSVHATNLDKELKSYKKKYDFSEDSDDELVKLTKQRDDYLQLYREAIEKMDGLMVENLNLRKKRSRK